MTNDANQKNANCHKGDFFPTKDFAAFLWMPAERKEKTKIDIFFSFRSRLRRKNLENLESAAAASTGAQFFDLKEKSRIRRRWGTGLPDVSRYNLPKRLKIYQITTKYIKMTIKYTK
jgi:hypothetical protein